MSNRFKAIGSFVYEKGNRIGATPDEASVELARKLNAYQMRIERLKAEVERLRASSFVTAVPSEEYEKLKAEVERLKAEPERLMFLLNNAYLSNDRLRKAGDAMADEIISCYCAEGYNPDDSETLPKWNAAKEGRPNE